MQQLRVVDLARTMGITPKELIFKLRSIGVSVAGEEDNLDLSTVRSIITGETLQKRPREVIVRSEARHEETAGASALDRLAMRRRRRVIKTEKEIVEVVAEPKRGPALETEAVEVEAEVETTAVDEVVEPAGAELAPPTEEAVEASTPETPEAAAETTPAELEAAPEVEPVSPEAESAGETAVVEEGHDVAAAEEEDEEEERKPAFEVTEEELTTGREGTAEEGPQRVRPIRAKTPLERSLRELSPDEIKQRLKAQKEAEQRRKEAKKEKPKEKDKGGPGTRKAKSAADAKEIRELLNKFEEQKLKGQQEGGVARPSAPRPGAPKLSKKARKRQQQQEATRRPAPPRPTRSVVFKDGDRPDGPIILSEMVTAKELADKLNVTAKDLLALLIGKGVMVTTNQSLPHALAEEICADLGVDAMVASAEEVIEFEREETQDAIGPIRSRPPVVTVMGHVDHGKTSLLDAIRTTRVAEGEAGGITQHIGASKVTTADGRTVVFVDTPGHQAFTQMRARGAQVTDLVVLVVAADDGVMPQTREAINHARAANVPLVVAMNKIDKANANPERVKQQLAEVEVLVEDWGGDVPCVPVSAKKGDGIPELLDMILLVSEMRDLKAADGGLARGIVLEARKEKGRGIVATVIVGQGRIAVGDYFFCGSTWGRARALADDRGQRIETAGPSEPVEVMGFDGMPGAGDVLQCVESEERALEVASFRFQRDKEEGLATSRKVSLDTLFDHMAEAESKELNIVVKADVQGSVEVLKETLASLGTEKVKIHVLHGSVGAVTTNDVMLASASNGIIIGFNVRPERTARELAETEQVDIRMYTVIYDLVDEVRKAMVGLLEPVFKEEELGHAEVREVFRVPKVGSIAGCHVVDGVIVRSARIRLLRDHVVVFQGQISSLKRFKDDAAEVRQGFECGIGIERFQDVKVGDVIEAYRMVEVAPEL